MTKYEEVQSKSHAITMGAASAVVLPNNPKRIRLILCPPVAGRYSVGFGEDAVLDRGITIFAGDHILELSKDYHGRDIERTIHVIGSVATTAGWFESYTP